MTLVVVPTYDERDSLEELVAGIFQHAGDAHILIVDDNSPDGTGRLADSLCRQYPGRIFVLHRDRKEGIGPAYLAGFRFALEGDYALICQMDADLSHSPKHLPALRDLCADCDLALGSRYLPGGAVVNWSRGRLLLSRAAGCYARFFLRIPFSDPTGGFKCWRRGALASLDLRQVFSNGYLFQIEMTYKAYRNGSRVREMPITFLERKLGRSKMSWRIVLEAILGVVRLRQGPC